MHLNVTEQASSSPSINQPAHHIKLNKATIKIQAVLKDIGGCLRDGLLSNQYLHQYVDAYRDQTVAVKQVYKSSDRNKQQCPIEREIAILKKLSGSPQVVQLLEVEQRQFRTNLVMTFSEYDLSQLITSLEYPVDRSIVKRVFHQLLQAVAYIHRQGVIHRDIKPSNILLTESLDVRLCDFGSAVELNEKAVKGEFDIEGFTKWYKAPEILFGDRKYTTSVDMWSLGCVFAEMLNGVPLFCGVNEIEQLVKIAELLGSPDQQNWPGIVTMPDFGKITFNRRPPANPYERFDHWDKQQVDFLGSMLRYENRSAASELLRHGYFAGFDAKKELLGGVHWKKRRTDQVYFSYQKLLKQ